MIVSENCAEAMRFSPRLRLTICAVRYALVCGSVFAAFLVTSCSAQSAEHASPLPSSTTPAPTSSAPTEQAPRRHTLGCVAPAGVSDSPRNINEALVLANALPKPLTLPCFLEALGRPLQISASNSIFSAQPADGPRSPRIFLFQEGMLMSIAPAGTGAPLLEFGEQRADFRSLKAEITFPVLAALPDDAPFIGFMYSDQITTCAVCHAAEEEEQSTLGVRGFVSQSLRPSITDKVTAARLQHELEICDKVAEPYRCAMLDGLMGWGSVTDTDFPLGIATFGNN